MARMLGDAFVVVGWEPNAAAMRADLKARVKAATSGIDPTITVNTDIKSVTAAIASLAARLKTLRLSADSTQAEAAVARLQARLAAVGDKVSKLTVTADTSKLDAQIAAETAKLATLRKQASNLQMNANTARAAAKIAGLQKQAADLYGKLDKLEADVDINAALTKIYAIEAEVKALQSRYSVIEFKANTDDLNAKITASVAKLAGLQQQASDIRLGTKVDTVGLAAATAQVLTLKAATDALTPSAAKTSSAWTILAKSLATTGVGWNATIGGVSGLHIVLDLAIEAAIAFGTALLAVGAAALAAYPAIDQISYGFSNSLKAMTALGVYAGPVAGKLDQLQRSVVPQVYEAFGGALNLVTGQMGVLGSTAHDVINLFDTWIAKIDLWSKSQGNMGALLHTGTGYLSQFGTVIGNLLKAISDLLTKDPGIARFLLDILNGVALLLGAFAKLPGPVVEATLALHGLWLWGRVLGGVLLIAASNVKTFAVSLAGLAVNPLFWVAVAAAGVGYLAYQMNTASASAKAFMANLEGALSNSNAGQAMVDISADVGLLRDQLDQAQGATGTLVTGLNSTAAAAGKSFTQVLKDAPLSNQWFKDLGGSILGAAKSFLGFQNAGVDMAQNISTVHAYSAEIIKLTGQQTDLFHVMGLLVRGTNDLGLGSLSAGNAIGLMDAAGVKAADGFSVMWQKIENLVAGYKAMSIQGGLLANSVNALDFATAQQDSHVSELNSAWDTFFRTVSGGATGFNAFATQSEGLYKSLGTAAAKLTVSNGKASLSLAATTATASGATPSITGLAGADIQLRDSFLQTANAANTQLSNLTLLASAAGLGSRGTSMLTQATKDMVAQLLPAAKGSKEMTAVLEALAQRGGFQPGGTASMFQQLARWVGNTRDPLASLDQITQTFTVDAANLTTDVKNLSIALGQNLNDAMSKALLQATGGQKAFDDFATALLNTKANSKSQQSAALELANQLVSLTGNTKDAHNEFDAFAQQMGIGRDQADQLWGEIAGKLDPVMANDARKLLPQLQQGFENWANNGLGYSKGKADDLWSQLIGKLGPTLSNLGDLAAGPAKKQFIDWAENGLHLSQQHAQDLWSELVTLQAQIDSMHGKTFGVIVDANGNVNVNGYQISAGAYFSPHAAGGFISGGKPGKDSVPAMLMPGEVVVPTSMVKAGAVDHLRGQLPGFASGGVVGTHGNLGFNTLPAFDSGVTGFVNYETVQIAVSAMKAFAKYVAQQKAAQDAAKAASKAGHINYSPGAGVAQWKGTVDAALQAAGAPVILDTNVLYQMQTESGGNPAAVNLTDSNAAAGHPSVGLMQVIAGTYAAYGAPRVGYPAPVAYGVSEQPFANIYAAIRYAQATYGPYLMSGTNGLGSGHGYAAGGLVTDQARELAAYYAFSGAFTRSLAHPAKGSWLAGHRTGILGELGTLRKRQATEEAAYDAVIRSGGASSRMSHYGTTLKGLARTLGDKDLSYPGAGGQPARLRSLLSWVTALERVRYTGSTSGGTGGAGGTGRSGPGIYLPPPAASLSSFFTSTTALRAALAEAQKSEFSSLFGLGNSYARGSEKYYTAGVRHDFGVLWQKHLAEQQAYNRLTGAGLTPAGLSALGTAANAEASAALRQTLSRSGAGGHPGWDANLRRALNQIITIARTTRGASGTGALGSYLPVMSAETDSFGGDIIIDSTGRTIALNAGPLGKARGGMIPSGVYDRGGTLRPGPNLAWNLTGRPEHLTRGSSGDIHIHLHNDGVIGSQHELDNWLTTSIRRVVKGRGGGSVQKALGGH